MPSSSASSSTRAAISFERRRRTTRAKARWSRTVSVENKARSCGT